MRVCRWVKFEEDVEEGGERWSKPHVASLALSSLQQLRAIIDSNDAVVEMFVEMTTIEELVGTLVAQHEHILNLLL